MENLKTKMKEIKNFDKIRTGDWIWTKNKDYPKKDKRQTIIIVKKNSLLVYAFNYKGEMMKFNDKKDMLSNTLQFYPEKWGIYKLNREEKEKFNREIILGSLK